jgi:hypothetical protein
VTDLDELLAEVRREVTSVLTQVDWAEAEITAARARHPGQADLLFHAFPLLSATADLMRTEFVYRGHVRDLLERVAGGGDTREATDAEVAVVLSEVSLRAPLPAEAVTLYMRTWSRAFPDTRAFDPLELDSYEHVAGSAADDLETDIRRRLRRPDRALAGITCTGLHHGEPAPDCPYVAGELPRRTGLGAE